MMGLAVILVCCVVSCCVAWHLRCLTASLGPGAPVRPVCKEDAWETFISCANIYACRKFANNRGRIVYIDNLYFVSILRAPLSEAPAASSLVWDLIVYYTTQ